MPHEGVRGEVFHIFVQLCVVLWRNAQAMQGFAANMQVQYFERIVPRYINSILTFFKRIKFTPGVGNTRGTFERIQGSRFDWGAGQCITFN